MTRLTDVSRRAGKVAGLALSAVTLSVFVYFCVRTFSKMNAQELAARHWIALLVATLVYCFAYAPMTLAWITLASASGARATRLDLARVLLVSQIGKYIPGNVAQFLGRAFMAHRYGVPFAASGLAITLELAGILIASGFLATAVIVFGIPSAPNGHTLAWASALAGIVALAVSAWILLDRKMQVKRVIQPLLMSLCLYLLVLSLLAVANVILVAGIGGDASRATATKVAGAFLVSWLVGFATPGSPAGLGVRELTFFGLLAAAISHDTLLLTAIAFRLATAVGDVLAFLLGILLRASTNESRPQALPL